MNTTKVALLTVLVLINIAFVIGWIWAARRYRLHGRPTPADVAIGFVTDFLDTLGIGSFAPTTALFKFRGAPADELIPGTLNVGHNAAAFPGDPAVRDRGDGGTDAAGLHDRQRDTAGPGSGQAWSVACRVAPFSCSWELRC